MTAAPAKKKTDGYRRALYGKIEVAKKQLGLDDDAYRDILRRKFGKDSRTRLTNAQLVDLVEHFKSLGFRPKPKKPRKGPPRAGDRPLADGKEIRKARALWLALYHLGIVRDPSENALCAFAKRISGGKAKGVDALQWLPGDAMANLIEALKKMAEREAGVCWVGYQFGAAGLGGTTVYAPRARVIEAQWSLLRNLGVNMGPSLVTDWLTLLLNRYPVVLVLPDHRHPAVLTDREADRVIDHFGAKIRAALAEKGCRDLKAWREKEDVQ